MEDVRLVKVKDISVNWNMSKRTMVELSLKSMLFTVRESSLVKIIEDSAILLSHGVLGRKFYDLLVFGSVSREAIVVELSNRILDICKTFKPYDFVVFVQNAYRHKERSSPEFNTIFLQMANLVFYGYGCGYLVGIIPNEESVYVNTEIIGPSEFLVTLMVFCTEKFGRISLANGDYVVKEFSYTKKQYERIQKQLSTSAVRTVYSQVNNMNKSDVWRVITSASKSADAIYFGNYFNYLPEGIYPNFSNFYSLASWEREETVKSTSVAIKIYEFMTNKFFGYDNLLKHRNIYVPDKGIVVVLDEKPDGIDRLFLREYHEGDFHFLYVGYTVDEVYRNLPIDMSSLSLSFIHVLYELDVVAL